MHNKMFMRKTKFHSNSLIDAWVFNQNDIHDIHFESFAGFLKSNRFFFIFQMYVDVSVLSCSMHSQSLYDFISRIFFLLLFPLFFTNISLRLLISLDICAYYCRVVRMLLCDT